MKSVGVHNDGCNEQCCRLYCIAFDPLYIIICFLVHTSGDPTQHYDIGHATV